MSRKISLKTIDSQEWRTPQKLFKKLDREFHFNLDPCATKENAKCKKYYTKKDNGLILKWFGNVFVNPPFNQVAKWVKKAYLEVEKGNAQIVVMLIASRTDTKYFHSYILPFSQIRFIKGRLQYGGATMPAPFPSMLVVFNADCLTPHIPHTYTFK